MKIKPYRIVFLLAVVATLGTGVLGWLWYGQNNPILKITIEVRPAPPPKIPYFVSGGDVYCVIEDGHSIKHEYRMYMADTTEKAEANIGDYLKYPDKEFCNWFERATNMKLTSKTIPIPLTPNEP